ncbi:MAG: peptidylprolyl isomerase [Bdellovibrionaceae bacterium]|nr:peptidylprolyl isomerase [Pseudobdellovibrionaceae bacterium]
MAVKSFSILISALMAFVGSAALAQANKDEAVAVVGTKKITVEEFNRKFNDVRNMAVNPPTKAQFLEDLVRYELGVQEAERRNLEKDPVVQDRMKQELYKALLEKELAERVNKIAVNEKEMEAYYKKNPEIRTSHILIELKPGATPEQRAEARKRATEIYEEVKKSKRPFEELVRLYSDDPLTKQTGGDVGYQSRITLVPSYYDAILAMKVGEIRGLIDTPFGFHIVKVTGRRSFDNANKRQLRAAVFDEKRKDIFNDYFDKLKKSYKIQTNPSLIQ